MLKKPQCLDPTGSNNTMSDALLVITKEIKMIPQNEYISDNGGSWLNIGQKNQLNYLAFMPWNS
jgi:hypothetical protein